VRGVYTSFVNVRHHELDAFGRVHPGVYLRYLAHAAVEASTAAGFDAAWYAAAGAVWLVRRSTFTVLRPATAGEELEIRTWVEDFRRVRSHRRYEVRGADGALRLVARTDWVYVDLASGRPRRVPADMEEAFGGTSVTQERDGWHAPPPPARPARATHQVRVYELDSLGHVNNAVYLDLVAQAALDASEDAGWPLARLVSDGTVPVLAGGDLEYREPARYGDRLDTTTWFAPLADALGVHQHVARAGDGRPVVRASTRWRWVHPLSAAAADAPEGLLAALESLLAARELPRAPALRRRAPSPGPLPS